MVLITLVEEFESPWLVVVRCVRLQLGICIDGFPARVLLF